MTRNARVCGFLVWAWVAAMACSLIPGGAFAQEEDSGSKVSTDEPIVHLKEFQRKMEHMRKRLSEVQPDPDAVGDARAGAITLQQHAADVGAVRDEFASCVASLKKRISDKEESGTATDKDKAEFKKCLDQCESILSSLNGLHLGATMLGSADHKTKWLVNGLEAHKKAVAELQERSAACEGMVHAALKCAEMHNAKPEAKAASVVATDEPMVHLKEFQRKMEHMRKRLSEVQPDPDAVGDVRAGAITLQQHAADVAAVRSEFTKCLASMKKRVADKEESGTATDKDKAEIKQCVDHCQTILDKLNTMHLNATVLGSADHKTKWIVSGLEAHKKAVEEVQALAAKCPDMIQKTLDCCKIKK